MLALVKFVTIPFDDSIAPPFLLTFAEASLGRIATQASVRGRGTGHALVNKAMACLQQEWGAQAIRIGAQAHLEAFYGQHGFEKAGPLYLEDGIPHLEMVRPA